MRFIHYKVIKFYSICYIKGGKNMTAILKKFINAVFLLFVLFLTTTNVEGNYFHVFQILFFTLYFVHNLLYHFNMILSLFSLQHILGVKKISLVQEMMIAWILMLFSVSTTFVNVFLITALNGWMNYFTSKWYMASATSIFWDVLCYHSSGTE